MQKVWLIENRFLSVPAGKELMREDFLNKDPSAKKQVVRVQVRELCFPLNRLLSGLFVQLLKDLFVDDRKFHLMAFL